MLNFHSFLKITFFGVRFFLSVLLQGISTSSLASCSLLLASQYFLFVRCHFKSYYASCCGCFLFSVFSFQFSVDCGHRYSWPSYCCTPLPPALVFNVCVLLCVPHFEQLLCIFYC